MLYILVRDGSSSRWSCSTSKLQVELALSGVGAVKFEYLSTSSKNNIQQNSLACVSYLSASQLAFIPFYFSLIPKESTICRYMPIPSATPPSPRSKANRTAGAVT
jgi:hypothetical protein